jgi:hypothetical protein
VKKLTEDRLVQLARHAEGDVRHLVDEVRRLRAEEGRRLHIHARLVAEIETLRQQLLQMMER